MAEFNSVQLKTIDQYRAKHNISPVVSNEAVAEQILAEMKASGVSYAGFESLISEVGSKTVIPERESSSLFEYGFTTDYSDGFVKSEPKPAPTYTNAQYNDAMEFAKEYLLDSATTVHETLINYKKDIGYISAGAVWHGFKNLGNLFIDRVFNTNMITTLWEKISFAEKEVKEAEALASIDKKEKGFFEWEFRKNQGVGFDVGKIQKFKTKSEEYMFVKTCKNQYDLLNNGIRELQGLLVREKQLERFGQNNVSIEKEKSFDERFIEILDQYCGGDEDMRNQLILEISGDIKSKDELEKKYLEVLNKLKDNAQKLYESQLGDKAFEEYHSEYVSSYKETFGGEDPEAEVQAWIAKQETGTQAIRMAAIIAATILTGGSATLANGAANLTAKIGATATQQLIKFGMTLEGVGVGVGLDYLNALTSETGLTEERNQEILQNAVHTLPYAIFGAYVSGPLGDKLASTLKGTATLPNILNNAIATSAKGVGFTAEVGLDVVFDAALRDGDLSEIIKGNINGEAQARALNMLMQAVAGGRAHYATKTIMENAGIKNCEVKADGGIKVETTDGKAFDIKPEESADFIARTLGKALEVEGGKLEGVKHDETKVEDAVRSPEVKNIDKQIDKFKVKKTEAHQALRAHVANGQKVKNNSNIILPVPKGVLEAPNAKFAETEKAFAEVVTKNQYELFSHHLQLKINGDKKAYIENVYNLFVKDMGLEGIAPKLEIKENIDNYDGGFLPDEYKIEIDSSKGEDYLVQTIAHELNHFLQYKEMMITGTDGIERLAYNDAVRAVSKANLENAFDGLSQKEFDILFKEIVEEKTALYKGLYSGLVQDSRYPHNNPNSYYGQKADMYSEGQLAYTGQGQEYINNSLEVESRNRGILVENTYKTMITNLEIEEHAVSKILEIYNRQHPTTEEKCLLKDIIIEELQKTQMTDVNRFISWFIYNYNI